jgi:SNF2 family DNA or RNA helicase
MTDNPFIETGSSDVEETEESLKKAMDEINQAVLDSIQAKEDLYEPLNSLSEEEVNLLKKVAEIKAKKREIEKYQRDLNAEARVKQAKLEDAKRRYQTFMSEKAIRDKMAAEFAEMDNRTLGAPWREMAYDHQIDGAKRLAVAKRAILGDKTGLGKTATSLIWADMVDAKKLIVVAPRDVLKNFEREVKTWTPYRKTIIVQGIPKAVRDQLFRMMQSTDEFVMLINYQAWTRDEELLQALIDLKVDTVICDEAHNMRELDTKAYQGVRKIVYAENCCNVCGGKPETHYDNLTAKRTQRCSLCFNVAKNFGDFCSVKNVLTMSGTSFVNKPQDLFAQLHLIDRENFSKLNHYLDDYCTQNDDGRWYFGWGGEKRLIARMGPRMVARTPESAGVKMPEQVNIPHEIEFEANLYKLQRDAMAQIRERSLELMTGEAELNITAAIAMYTRLRQAVTWPAGIKIKDPETGVVLYQCSVEESIIMDKAESIGLQAIEEGDRVIMFSQFKEVLKEMEQRLKRQGITCVRLDGDASSDLRDRISLDFDSKGAISNPDLLKKWDPVDNPNGYKYQVVLAHYRVGGVGLNLDLARQTVLIDRPWNPATEKQAMARNNRLNTKHTSIVHTIHVPGTVTDWLDDIIKYKEEMQEGVENDINVAESLMSALRDGKIM